MMSDHRPIGRSAPSKCLGLLLCALATANAAVMVVAHRGAKLEAPENTLAAYARAAELGADYVEVDVRAAADGNLVIMHDSRVDRTTNGKGAIRELTLRQIRELDAGLHWRPRFANTPVPTFEEVLAFAKARGIRVDVDHKDGPIEAIAAAIRKAGMTGWVVIEGGVANLAKFAVLLPGVDTMPKVESVAEVAEVCRRLNTKVVRLSLEQLESRDFVAAVHREGARVSVTILGAKDNEETMRRVAGQGAELIETDHPELLDKVRQALPASMAR